MKIYPLDELTPKQYRVLHYIKSYVNEYGIFPSYSDMMYQFDFASPNSVSQNLKALEKKGYLLKRNGEYELSENRDAEHQIPIKGIITAGRMQEAVGAEMGMISLRWLFPKYKDLFALRIAGDSMIGDELFDGDYAILANTAIRDGDIVAIMLGDETTLKHFYRERHSIRLRASNPAYEDRVIPLPSTEDIRILGKLVGVANDRGIFKR